MRLKPLQLKKERMEAAFACLTCRVGRTGWPLGQVEIAFSSNRAQEFSRIPKKNGKAVRIYDGRRSLSEGQSDTHSIKSAPTSKLASMEMGKGEIHYLRDFDDEPFDSDEDPDDDLDI